jgi:hypothetical protein
MHSEAAREGYIRIGASPSPQVLDGWGQPFHVVYRTNLVHQPKAPPTLLAKTNAVLVWSSGPNKTNEFGNGDDMFLR